MIHEPWTTQQCRGAGGAMVPNSFEREGEGKGSCAENTHTLKSGGPGDDFL